MFHYVAQQDTADCKWLQRSIAKLKVESNTTMSEQHEQNRRRSRHAKAPNLQARKLASRRALPRKSYEHKLIYQHDSRATVTNPAKGVPNSEPDYMAVEQLQDVRMSGAPSHFAAQAKQAVDRIALPTSVRAEHER